MSSLKPVTDKGLDAERRRGKHRRSEKIDETINKLICIGLWVAAVIVIFCVIICAGIYMRHILYPESVSQSSVDDIERIATHLFAAGGGYLAHLIKRNIQS